SSCTANRDAWVAGRLPLTGDAGRNSGRSGIILSGRSSVTRGRRTMPGPTEGARDAGRGAGDRGAVARGGGGADAVADSRFGAIGGDPVGLGCRAGRRAVDGGVRADERAVRGCGCRGWAAGSARYRARGVWLDSGAAGRADGP